MPHPTATPDPPEPDDRLDVPVTVWLAPRPGHSSRTRQPAVARDAFALPSWVLTRLADLYTTPLAGPHAQLRLWRPPNAGPLVPPRWSGLAAGIVVDLTTAGLPADTHAVAVLHAAAENLTPGGYVFAVTAYDPDGAEEVCGPLVRAAVALGLAYVQHLIAVNGHADGDRIVPHPGDAPPTTGRTGRPVHVPVHTDLLVFRTPLPDTPSGTGR
ncbi:hypothetical protein [Yinghuangia seranimata]|uniref:hypothetical protein n=1 Tax=Yinghuangia seranimata TaxID=408067 RepID=UPI00248BCC97|nr:hypothetical protein [Yinghuangia seranimata]MDI2130570.1 hypothetical protein [Yinghuangia seranimata]